MNFKVTFLNAFQVEVTHSAAQQTQNDINIKYNLMKLEI